MQFLFLDFETYWSDEYTLRKLTPIEYVLDVRFEALGCAFGNAEGTGDHWVDGPDLPRFFSTINWAETYAVSHNALFDMLVLSAQYKVFPKMYGDTLSMARNWIQHMTGRVSLEACKKFYGLSPKMTTAQRTKGVAFSMLRQMPDLHNETIAYGLDDMQSCRQIFRNIMADGFPVQQLKVVDWVVRMAAQPKFQLNSFVLAEYLNEVRAEKAQLLARCNLDNRDNLMRDSALVAMLLFAGVENVPQKRSKATGKLQFAFAKTDKEFTALLEHENPDVQALVAARLGHKTTIEETRAERLLKISQIVDKVPVPLKYSGAHTHRFSGDWSINFQNLKRGGKLRKSLEAPYGQRVISVDASQIEARINATFSGQRDLMEQFALGMDVYSLFAEQIYHYKVNKIDQPTERFVGKTGILSLGYGSSGPVFQSMCRVQSGGKVLLKDSEAFGIVSIYRDRYKRIVSNWYHADRVILPAIARGEELDWGPVRVKKNALLLPNGNYLRYRDLRREMSPEGKWTWIYMRGDRPCYTYGAKLVENVVQALAFVHIEEVALRVSDMTDGLLWASHQVHDELLYVEDVKIAEQVKMLVKAEMSKSPVWMPDAPLAADGNIGLTYGDSK